MQEQNLSQNQLTENTIILTSDSCISKHPPFIHCSNTKTKQPWL